MEQPSVNIKKYFFLFMNSNELHDTIALTSTNHLYKNVSQQVNANRSHANPQLDIVSKKGLILNFLT
jgi:hypothetical protein